MIELYNKKRKGICHFFFILSIILLCVCFYFNHFFALSITFLTFLEALSQLHACYCIDIIFMVSIWLKYLFMEKKCIILNFYFYVIKKWGHHFGSFKWSDKNLHYNDWKQYIYFFNLVILLYYECVIYQYVLCNR